MKKIILLSILLSLLSNCSNDSSENTIKNNNLIGKWTPEFEREYSDKNILIEEYDISKEECYHMTTYEFKSNNKYVKDSYDFDGKNCIKNILRTYNYSLDNNVLTIESEQLIIIENTSNILKLKSTTTDNNYTIIEYSKVN